MGVNHNVPLRTIRSELRRAGWVHDEIVGHGEELWRPEGLTDGPVFVRFQTKKEELGPKQVHGIRKRIAEHAAVRAIPEAQPGPEADTVLLGPAVPEEGAVFEVAAGFDPRLPVGTPVVVVSLDPVTVDVPTRGRRGLVVRRWAAVASVGTDLTPYPEADPEPEPEPEPEPPPAPEPPPEPQEAPRASEPPEPVPEVPTELCAALKVPRGSSLRTAVERAETALGVIRHHRQIAVDAGAPSNLQASSAIGWLAQALEHAQGRASELETRAGRAEATLEEVERALTEAGIPIAGDGLAGRIRRFATHRTREPDKRSTAELRQLRAEVERLTAELEGRRCALAATDQAHRNALADLDRALAELRARPTGPAAIPNWSDDRIEGLARQLGMVDVLRWMLGRPPTRDDLIAAALGALEDRLGRPQ